MLLLVFFALFALSNCTDYRPDDDHESRSSESYEDHGYGPDDDDSSNNEESNNDDSPQCTGINEEFDPCPPHCHDDSCSSVPFRTLQCFSARGHECKPECRCKKPFARNNGVCIPVNQCPPRDKKP